MPNRTSHLRRRVLEQLRAGSATGPELAAVALEGRGGRARKLILVWLEAGFITRHRESWVGPGAAPYRYTITELGLLRPARQCPRRVPMVTRPSTPPKNKLFYCVPSGV